MLVLGRYESEWVEITHKSGDRLMVRVNRIHASGERHNATVSLAFDDPDRNFEIERPERNSPRPEPKVACDSVVIPIDRRYYRGTLVEPGFDEFEKR